LHILHSTEVEKDEKMGHQAKRPYNGSQPSITSYFASSSAGNDTHIYSISAPSSPSVDPRQPTLPNSIQSSLLNVGMRVRKSVPEGYKTGTYSAFQLFADAYTVPSSPTVSNTPTPPKTRPRAGARELTPFCGLLKVGGMAGQQWGIYNPGHQRFVEEYAVEEEMDLEDVPFLSSQGSAISNECFGLGNKRRFSEEEDEDEDIHLAERAFLSDRAIAVPKRKMVMSKVPCEAGVKIVGQNFNGDIDFQDAEFLDYGLVEEVEMEGM
jgi:hypothetical protein